MERGALVLANFDARIPKIEIKPKNRDTEVTITCRMADEAAGRRDTLRLRFLGVAAISFEVNCFDNCVGAEAFGLYRIDDRAFIEEVVRRNFHRRREVYLREGDYAFDADDPSDLLNALDLDGSFRREIGRYAAYVQNVDAGAYVIVARELRIEPKGPAGAAKPGRQEG